MHEAPFRTMQAFTESHSSALLRRGFDMWRFVLTRREFFVGSTVILIVQFLIG